MVYYILYDGGKDGPFDLLGIIRKIRNGTLQKHHLVSIEDKDALPAYQHNALYEIFIEQDNVERELSAAEVTQNVSFGGLLKAGFSILKEDQTAAILTGSFMLFLFFIVGGGIMVLPLALRSLLIPVLSYLLFSVCIVAMLRISRVQLLSFRYFVDIFKHHLVPLLIVSLPVALIAFTIPWMLANIIGKGAWVLTLIAGVPLMAYTFYVPLLLSDRELSLGAALRLNHKLMKSLGIEFYFLVLGLLMINVLAVILIIVPLVLLPATLLALMILYDRSFNDY